MNARRRSRPMLALLGLAALAIACGWWSPATDAPTPTVIGTDSGPVGEAPSELATSTLSAAPTAGPAPVSTGFGILGDSISDEYRANDNRGGVCGFVTYNWMEQLAERHGLNFGRWGEWGEPRRTGFEYNWARSGARARDLIATGQAAGLAAQVANGEVSDVIIWIGSNDFSYYTDTYTEIYDGRLNDSEVAARVDEVSGAIETAVETLKNAGPVRIVVVTIPDGASVPDVQKALPDAAGRQRVSDAVAEANRRITAFAAGHGLGLVDVNAMLQAFSPRLDGQGNLLVGDQRISLLGQGDEPHQGRLGDSAGHLGTVVSGLIANLMFVEPFNRTFGLGLQPLSDTEILKSAGLDSPTANSCKP